MNRRSFLRGVVAACGAVALIPFAARVAAPRSRTRAAGGPIHGPIYIIGEAGPERIAVTTDGVILSAAQFRDLVRDLDRTMYHAIRRVAS